MAVVQLPQGELESAYITVGILYRIILYYLDTILPIHHIEVIGREVLLAYLDFNAPFEIRTDASKLQVYAVIPQKGSDMWQKGYGIIAPLISVTSKNSKYDWKDENQNYLMLSNV